MGNRRTHNSVRGITKQRSLNDGKVCETRVHWRTGVNLLSTGSKNCSAATKGAEAGLQRYPRNAILL
eukprot:1927543-Rhodomonas_salina.1